MKEEFAASMENLFLYMDIPEPLTGEVSLFKLKLFWYDLSGLLSGELIPPVILSKQLGILYVLQGGEEAPPGFLNSIRLPKPKLALRPIPTVAGRVVYSPPKLNLRMGKRSALENLQLGALNLYTVEYSADRSLVLFLRGSDFTNFFSILSNFVK